MWSPFTWMAVTATVTSSAKPQFAQMKPGALFLNLSRGFVIDLGALRAHLESGHLAGAALDVFPDEPRSKADPFISELQGLQNVILTPHVGGSTEEAQEDIGRFVAENLISYLDSGSTALSVNLPNLTCLVKLRLIGSSTSTETSLVSSRRSTRSSPNTGPTWSASTWPPAALQAA